jgi:hypothetical protein
LSPICFKCRLNASKVSEIVFIHLPVHNIRLVLKTSAPLERTRNIGLEKEMGLLHLVLFIDFSYIEEHANTYKPVWIRMPRIQTNRNIDVRHWFSQQFRENEALGYWDVNENPGIRVLGKTRE